MATLLQSFRDKSAVPPDVWRRSARTLVLESLANAQLAHSQTMRAQWQKLRDFLDGLHRQHTLAHAYISHPQRARKWAEGDAHAFRYFRLVQLIAERLSVVFHRPPELYLHTGDGIPLLASPPHKGMPPEAGRYDPRYAAQVRQWEKDREDAELDTLLSHIDMSVRVLGQQVVVPSWISDGDHQRIEWIAYDPQDVLVDQSDSDPANMAVARAVMLALRQPEESVARRQPFAYSTWTRTVVGDETIYRHWVHEPAGDLLRNSLFGPAEGVNEYGMIPCVLWQIRRPVSGEIFIQPDEALIQAQLGVNISLTDLAHGMRYYAHPQWIQKGELRTPTVFGPDSIAQLDEDGDLTTHTPSTNLAEYRTTIEWQLRTEAVSRSLPPDLLNPSAARNLSALQEQRHDLMMERERVRPHYERAMRQTFRVHKRVGNTAARLWGADRVVYSDEIELGMRLSPIPRVEDPWQAAQARMLSISQGVASAVEDIMDSEGVDREEATRRMLQRIAESRLAESHEPPKPGQPPASAKPAGDQPRPASVERG